MLNDFFTIIVQLPTPIFVLVSLGLSMVGVLLGFYASDQIARILRVGER